jgi:chaperonin GroEL (HSP60 family)
MWHMQFQTQSESQLVALSAAQDVEAGDGTTSVVVLAGSLLGAAESLLAKGTIMLIVSRTEATSCHGLQAFTPRSSLTHSLPHPSKQSSI